MEEKEIRYKQGVKWSIFYIIIYSLFTISLMYIEPKIFKIVLGIVGLIFIVVYTFTIRYNKERLFVLGLISMFAVMHMGIAFGSVIDIETVIAIGIAVSIMDVLSFTKYGKNTANAKAMSNIQFVSKLIVYGKTRNNELIPTCGLGDYLYYAIWIVGIHNVSDKLWAYAIASLLIFIGTLVDSIIIGYIYKKDNYNGFPATIIPFSLVSIFYGFLYFLN
ncbi:hypothetical protein CDLVIII_4654 [Clostridium sp. DL-VIII]|uniref:hypothetical protein n=1 Tax=Clostridium sp. DL-VIII TaxID=641107 RepID=UPI00023B088C|nr:hypothetical protein [Clostridium sp. DL-VIII]EHJ01157.1 hypothetical protein CDLVIII_4654 [Clostridium sp. DL-VIII]